MVGPVTYPLHIDSRHSTLHNNRVNSGLSIFINNIYSYILYIIGHCEYSKNMPGGDSVLQSASLQSIHQVNRLSTRAIEWSWSL